MREAVEAASRNCSSAMYIRNRYLASWSEGEGEGGRERGRERGEGEGEGEEGGEEGGEEVYSSVYFCVILNHENSTTFCEVKLIHKTTTRIVTR